jgi:hypothetical protein
VRQVDLRRELEQLHGEMLRRAAAGRSIVDLARFAAGKCDQLRERADAKRGMNDERQSAGCDLGDRHEILLRIVRYVG